MEVMTPVNIVRAPKCHEGGITIGLPDSSYRAFEILYFTFVVAPGLAGLGKVFGLFADWARFMPPAMIEILSPHMAQYVRAVGLCELALAVTVAARPRLGGWLAAVWLWIGIIDLLSIPGHYGIVGCFGVMSAGAVALGYLALEFDKKSSRD